MHDPVTRRRFLRRATAAIGGALAAGWVLPAIPYVLGSASASQRVREWRALGSVTKVQPGTPTLFKTRVEHTTGWVTEEKEIAVYVVTDDGRDFIALSNICTHLGCRVRWVEDQESFFCPCHNAVFSKTGQVISGPPPRPLDRYDVKVEGAQLLVKVEA